jgi:hypothetical protein
MVEVMRASEASVDDADLAMRRLPRVMDEEEDDKSARR